MCLRQCGTCACTVTFNRRMHACKAYEQVEEEEEEEEQPQNDARSRVNNRNTCDMNSEKSKDDK